MEPNLLNKAIDIATQAHKGQVDKAGKSYISHPLRVMKMGETIEEKIVGVLHDVIEDTPCTFESLRAEGFPDKIIDALRCVTKLSEDEPYEEFIQRVKKNPLAIKVKLHDLSDNMDIRRLPSITDKDVKRLCKYLNAYHELLPLAESRKKVVYIDMDNVLVDFQSEIDHLDETTLQKYSGRLDEVPHIFSKMKPVKGGIEAYKELSAKYEVYILSTAPWNNPSAWSDKLEWVKKYLPDHAYKRLILSHHKNLCKGDYIIDDRQKHGVDISECEHIHFGTERFPDWESVLEYCLGAKEEKPKA